MKVKLAVIYLLGVCNSFITILGKPLYRRKQKLARGIKNLGWD